MSLVDRFVVFRELVSMVWEVTFWCYAVGQGFGGSCSLLCMLGSCVEPAAMSLLA